MEAKCDQNPEKCGINGDLGVIFDEKSIKKCIQKSIHAATPNKFIKKNENCIQNGIKNDDFWMFFLKIGVRM